MWKWCEVISFHCAFNASRVGIHRKWSWYLWRMKKMWEFRLWSLSQWFIHGIGDWNRINKRDEFAIYSIFFYRYHPIGSEYRWPTIYIDSDMSKTNSTHVEHVKVVVSVWQMAPSTYSPHSWSGFTVSPTTWNVLFICSIGLGELCV